MESVPPSRATFIILNTDETYSECGCNSQSLVDEIRKKVPFHAIFLWDETLHYLYDTANPTCIKPKATRSLSALNNFLRQTRLETDNVVLIAPQSILGNTECKTEDFVTCIVPNELKAYIESHPEIASNPDKSKIISLPSPSSNDIIYFQNDSFTKENCGSDIIGLVEQFMDVTYQSGKISLYSFYGSVAPVYDIRNFPVSVGDFNPDALVNDICVRIKNGMKAFVIFNDDDTMDQFNEAFMAKADDDNIIDLFLKSVTLMTCNRVASFYECYNLTFDVVYPEFKVQNIKDTIKLQIVLMPSSQNDSVMIAPDSIAELSFTGAKVQTHLNGVVKLSNENMSKLRYKKLEDQEEAPQIVGDGILVDATHHLILDFSMEPCRIAGLFSYPRHVHFTISKGDHICFNGSRSVISNYLCGSLFDQFPYTVMVWGAPGSGKTSLINTMGNAMSLPYSKRPLTFMTIGDSKKHITSEFTKTKISKISANGKNGNQSVTNKLNTFFIDVPGADPEMAPELYINYCEAALDGKIPQDVNIIKDDGALKLDNLCNPDPLMIPQAVILVMKQGTDPSAQEIFIQLCQRRNIHPILVWTHSKAPYDYQEEQDLGIHKEYIFHIDSYKNANWVRNPETDVTALDILEAVHSEASLHHFRITKESYANAKFKFPEETPKEYVKACGFPESTMLKVFLLGNEEPLPLSAPPESRTEFPFKDLPFTYRPRYEGAYVGIEQFKKLIKDNGGFDLTDYNFIMQKSATSRKDETKKELQNPKSPSERKRAEEYQTNLLHYVTHAGSDANESFDDKSEKYYAYLFVTKEGDQN